MYAKYHTNALVLGSREHGESDRVYALYTKDFGLVRARAVSVRAERSRLRYALSHYALSDLSFVLGKSGWKITGAAPRLSLSGGGADVFARIARLVMRLVSVEDANEYLFSTLTDAHRSLSENSTQRGTIELLCAARILFSLGYVSADALGTALFTHTAYEMEQLSEAEYMRETLLASVNRAITESQL